YDENGENRRENITDWALGQFQSQYTDESISKWDIFYYVYGLLHHPTYRERCADNLKRELPRLPCAPDFWAVSNIGKSLADLHLDYESIAPHPLQWVENSKVAMSDPVENMRLRSESDGSLRVQVNNWLTLAGILSEVQTYRLGNRSALEWVID